MVNNYKVSAYRHIEENKLYWVAATVEFPAVLGIGSTREEALADLDEGIEEAIEYMIELGLPIPEPLVYNPDTTRNRLKMRHRVPYRAIPIKQQYPKQANS